MLGNSSYENEIIVCKSYSEATVGPTIRIMISEDNREREVGRAIFALIMKNTGNGFLRLGA